MSERQDHLIERAAAKLRAANNAQVPTSHGDAQKARPSGPPPNGAPPAAESSPPPLTTAPAIAMPPATPPRLAAANGTSPVFKPFVLPTPGSPMPPVVGPQPLRPAQAAPITLTPPAAAEPAPPQARRPIAFGDSVQETVPGPIPAPAAPLTRPVINVPPVPVVLNPGMTPMNAASPAPAGLAPPGTAAPANNLATSFATLADPAIPRPGLATPVALQPPPIVQLDALERAGMVVARTTRTRISEEYRIAIGRILRTLHETTDIQGARNVLMVTSARPGEGKSFTALNLAGSIAQNGTDAVLLVDVDPKVKPLSDQLGLGDAHGFLDLVSDPSLRPEDLLRVTAIPNLAIMPVGTRLGGAAQTVGGTASMRPIIPTITRLARRFPKHLIMLDAPPCLSTSDPHTLAPHVGQVVLVVEAERTQRSEVEAAIDLVRVCPSITMLLNKVRMTSSHTFGAYDYFGSYT